jgi:hypothetical protein
MRRAASCGQPLQLIAEPRGARMMRVPTVMTVVPYTSSVITGCAKDQKVRIVRALVNVFSKNSFS